MIICLCKQRKIGNRRRHCCNEAQAVYESNRNENDFKVEKHSPIMLMKREVLLFVASNMMCQKYFRQALPVGPYK